MAEAKESQPSPINGTPSRYVFLSATMSATEPPTNDVIIEVM
jgi:hypothetical protein